MKSQVGNYMGLERLQYLEFVVLWLEEHRRQLSALSYQRLRLAARRQLAALKSSRRRHAVARAAAAGAAQRELALVTATRAALGNWGAAGALTPAAAQRLDRQLSRHGEDLKLELAGRPDRPELSALDAIDYALGALPEWSRLAALTPAERLSLAVFLRRQKDDLRGTLRRP